MIYDRAKQIIVATLGADPDTVEPESRFAALGADSLDMLEISIELEDAFGLTISDEDMLDVETVQQAVDKVQELMG